LSGDLLASIRKGEAVSKIEEALRATDTPGLSSASSNGLTSAETMSRPSRHAVRFLPLSTPYDGVSS